MTPYAALMYSITLVLSAVAIIIMHKVQPDSTALYLVWVYLIDIVLFLFLFFYTSDIASQTAG